MSGCRESPIEKVLECGVEPPHSKVLLLPQAYARGQASFYKNRNAHAKTLASFVPNRVLCKDSCMIQVHE
jgi:hypothetical protein